MKTTLAAISLCGFAACVSSESSTGSQVSCGPGTTLVANQCVAASSAPSVESSSPSSSSGAADAAREVDAGVDAAPPPTGVVSLRWLYFDSTANCSFSPVTCPSTATCPVAGACHCQTCATPGACQPYTITPTCCATTATIALADVAKLVQDYPECPLSQTSPTTYALDCNGNADPDVYWTFDGSKSRGRSPKYTTDKGCKWDLPYAFR